MRTLPSLFVVLVACGTPEPPATGTEPTDPAETETPVLPAEPVADEAFVAEGESILIDVLANDPVTGTVTIATAPLLGTAEVELDGVRYTHDGSETVRDSFVYAVDGVSAGVIVNITPVNDPPVANDDSAVVDAGSIINLDLTANDVDEDDGIDATSIVLSGTPEFGTLTVLADGTVDYTHTTQGGVLDAFTYTVADRSGAVSNSARVEVEIAGGCGGADPNSVYFNRFEGIGSANACKSDLDCVVGGCSGEVCAAESVFTTCELLPEFPSGNCACVLGECIWSVCPAP